MTDKYPMCEKFGLSLIRRRSKLVEPYRQAPHEFAEIMFTSDVESKLQSLHDSATTVYGDVRDGTFYFCDPRAGVKNEISHADTHTAKLMFIEEIKKAEPCKHEVSMSQAYGGPLVIHSNDNRGTRIRITCCKCGVEVKPTWESAE